MRLLILVSLALTAWLSVASPSHALEAVEVPASSDAIDLTRAVELYPNSGPSLQVSTAPGADGIVRRIEVNSLDDANSSWAVFALSNPGDEQIDRLIVAPFFRNPQVIMEAVAVLPRPTPRHAEERALHSKWQVHKKNDKH